MSKQKQQGNSCGIAQTKRYALCSPAGQLRKRSAAGRATLWGFSILALVSSLALAGCGGENGAQEVTGSVSITPTQVGAPSVTPTESSGYLLLKWKAVENASGYRFYIRQEGKTPVSSYSGSATYNDSDDTYHVTINLTTTITQDVGKKFSYGVQSVADTAVAPLAENSNVAWTGYYAMIATGTLPGGGGGGGGGGGSKPAELSSGATYQQAIDKLDAIIEYCNNNPGGTNDGYKSSAEYYRTMISGTNYQTNWSGYSSTVISQINSLITNLQ